MLNKSRKLTAGLISLLGYWNLNIIFPPSQSSAFPNFIFWNFFFYYFIPKSVSAQTHEMANACLQVSGFFLGFVGWLGIVVATATDDWVTICKFGLTACKRLDELVARGPWAECLISTGRYHCLSLTQMLELPGRNRRPPSPPRPA